jgi:hypothetical protein
MIVFYEAKTTGVVIEKHAQNAPGAEIETGGLKCPIGLLGILNHSWFQVAISCHRRTAAPGLKRPRHGHPRSEANGYKSTTVVELLTAIPKRRERAKRHRLFGCDGHVTDAAAGQSQRPLF